MFFIILVKRFIIYKFNQNIQDDLHAKVKFGLRVADDFWVDHFDPDEKKRRQEARKRRAEEAKRNQRYTIFVEKFILVASIGVVCLAIVLAPESYEFKK